MTGRRGVSRVLRSGSCSRDRDAAAAAGDPARALRAHDPELPAVRAGGQGRRAAGGRHPVRVHAARADHGGRGRAGVPLRRLGQDDPGRRGAPARQPVPADQVDLRLSRPAEQSVPGNGRPGGGGDHLRRQEEDVRADGAKRGRCTSWNCRRKSTIPTPSEHWVRELRKFRSFLEQRFQTQITA